MKTNLSRAILLLLLAGTPALSAATLFEDGFEQGLSAWTPSTTNQGRVTADTAHGPASGTHHLILDDSANDSTSSVAEATLALDISYTRNLILEFKAKSLGNEPHAPPAGNFTSARNHDAVAISTDGGTTWRSVQSLATVSTTWSSHAIPLDPAIALLDGNFGPGFRIRFSAYDNAPAPLDGIAIDDVRVSADADQRAIVQLTGPVDEGSGPHTGRVLLHYAPEAPLTLALSATAGTPLLLPASVSVPAGATSADFTYSVAEDDVLTLTRTTSVTATAPGLASTAGSVAVLDNEAHSVTLNLPAVVREGESPSNNATLTLQPAPAIPVTIGIAANPSGQLSLPTTLAVPAGQSEVAFAVFAINDSLIDGSATVLVQATAPGLNPVSATTIAADNDNPNLILDVQVAASIQEGRTSSGTLVINGTLLEPLVISLQVPGDSSVTVPASVTINPGQQWVSFPITVADNALPDGTRTVPLVASAAGFNTTTRNLVVRDNEIASYAIAEVKELMDLGVLVYLKVSPLDIEGNTITSVTGPVNLELVLPDGSTQPTTPPSVNLTNSQWAGNLTIPSVHHSGLRLRASDSAGSSGLSTPFDAVRTLTMKTADIVSDPVRNRIYAAVAASDATTHANKVVAIDPLTLQVVASVPTGQDPRKLCLSQDGQYLYASLYGNGHIAKIDLATMTQLGSFAVGNHPAGGLLYAFDISTVDGQPDTLVVSQAEKSSQRPDTVAVYDNGVARPQTANGDYSQIVPSADPAIYVGFSGRDLSRLQLDANGITMIESGKSQMESFASIESRGNTIYYSNGRVAEGPSLEPVGSFPASGPIWPDLAAHAVYFVSNESSISSTPTHVSVYHPDTYALMRQKALPSSGDLWGAVDLVRWGVDGLAFRTNSGVKIISTDLVVPETPADLQVSVSASPDPAPADTAVTYSVQVSNQGPNPATGTVVTATLSAGQGLFHGASSAGNFLVSGSTITWNAGDLAVGASATLTLEMAPQGPGNPSCQARASSRVSDPDGSDNVAVEFVNVGFQPQADRINTLRLAAKSMIYDETRELLWLALSPTEPAPYGRSLVSVDPHTGEISAPIPIGAAARDNAIALSGNGRYLYLGLSDLPQFLRIDLEASPPAIVRVPLSEVEWSRPTYAFDIEVLEGDGKSVLVGTTGGSAKAVVFDDLTLRGPTNNMVFSATLIEPTATPGVFVGFDTTSTNQPLLKLRVIPEGLESLEDQNAYGGYMTKMVGDGGLLLTGGGYLLDSSDLSLKLSWTGSTGSPCLDTANHRAYRVIGKDLQSYRLDTGLVGEKLVLPTTQTNDWSLSCVRWGRDGMAVLGGDGTLHLIRWSAIIDGSVDSDNDGVSDAWENAHFGELGTDLEADADGDGLPGFIEYLFGTSPRASSENPLKSSFAGLPHNPLLVLEFPRRSDALDSYQIQISPDLLEWDQAADVAETIIGNRTTEGVIIETVRAQIPLPSRARFARIKWITP
jgi:uncharacterized repeat protein (TIGR01451 family)